MPKEPALIFHIRSVNFISSYTFDLARYYNKTPEYIRNSDHVKTENYYR